MRLDTCGKWIAAAFCAATTLGFSIAEARAACPTNPDQSKANLKGQDLSGCNLDNFDFSHANLDGANLSGASLKGANLASANLDHADLAGAKLDNVQLSKANLDHANLSGATLTNASLTKANLDHANLSGANLTGADFTKANADHATLGGGACGGDLSDANTKHATGCKDPKACVLPTCGGGCPDVYSGYFQVPWTNGPQMYVGVFSDRVLFCADDNKSQGGYASPVCTSSGDLVPAGGGGVCGWDSGFTATFQYDANQSAVSLHVVNPAHNQDEVFPLTPVPGPSLPAWCAAQIQEGLSFPLSMLPTTCP